MCGMIFLNYRPKTLQSLGNGVFAIRSTVVNITVTTILILLLSSLSRADQTVYVNYFQPEYEQDEAGTITIKNAFATLNGDSYKAEPIAYIFFLCKNEILVYFVNPLVTFLHAYVSGQRIHRSN